MESKKSDGIECKDTGRVQIQRGRAAPISETKRTTNDESRDESIRKWRQSNWKNGL